MFWLSGVIPEDLHDGISSKLEKHEEGKAALERNECKYFKNLKINIVEIKSHANYIIM